MRDLRLDWMERTTHVRGPCKFSPPARNYPCEALGRTSRSPRSSSSAARANIAQRATGFMPDMQVILERSIRDVCRACRLKSPVVVSTPLVARLADRDTPLCVALHSAPATLFVHP